jgi:lipopolysaccharide export system permease protein
VMVASILVLPFLALPFAMGRRRGQRAYRFGIALVILIAYHEVIQQGALITKLTGASPYLTIWAPFALLSAFALWRFRAVCFLVNPDKMEWLVERLAQLTAAVRSVIVPRAKAARP